MTHDTDPHRLSPRPVIGLVAEPARGRFGPWDHHYDALPRSYSLAVGRAGGLPLLLPPDDGVAQDPDQLLDLLDGLVLTGGCDVDPVSYGAAAHPETRETSPERDRFELSLAHAALEHELPLLGVCRGMEMLNVATGGTLVQHLPEQIGHDRHAHTPGAFADHDVELDDGSLAARAAGGSRVAVKSHHHQGVGELGEGLAATGRSAGDDVIEAIELPGGQFALGVLWHPEEDEGSRVFASLVQAARGSMARA